MRKSWISYLVRAACAAVLAWGLGCSRGPVLRSWFVDSLVKVFPDDAPGANKLDSPVFHAARNSSFSIELALRAPAALGDIYVDALPLKGAGMPVETISVRPVEYVVVASNTRSTPDEDLVRKAPALFPDALSGGFPMTIQKNTTRSLWVTVHVPAGQLPGDYKGTLRIRQGKERVSSVPYTLVVHPATVPARIPLAVSNYFNLSERHLMQFYGVSPFSEAWWQIIANYAHFLARYHQTSIGAYAVDLVKVDTAGGGLRYDFSNFERFVETFELAGVDRHIEGGNLLKRERRRDAPLMVDAWTVESGKAVRRNLPAADPAAQRFLHTFLPALYQRLVTRGWTSKYLQGILDEPEPWEQKQFMAVAGLVRKLMPGVRTIEPVGANQDLAFMEKTVDIWIPQLGTFDDKLDVLQNHVGNGGEVWFYTCLAPRGKYPNRFIDYSLTKVRILHWFNYRYNFRGFLHWGGNFWGPEPLRDTQPVINEGRTFLPPGDAYITYPDVVGRSLHSSIRLEQMREGIEDFGLLDELRKKDPARADALAGEAIQSFTAYVRDPRRFREIYRRLLDSF